jgi:hypothetical protein
VTISPGDAGNAHGFFVLQSLYLKRQERSHIVSATGGSQYQQPSDILYLALGE